MPLRLNTSTPPTHQIDNIAFNSSPAVTHQAPISMSSGVRRAERSIASFFGLLSRQDSTMLSAAIDRWGAEHGGENAALACEEIKKVVLKITPHGNKSELCLNGSQLRSLPAELALGQTKTLKNIDLSNNQLTRFPAEMGQAKALDYLNLSNNQLTSFPAEMGQAKALKYLLLSNNKLTSFPAEMGQAKALKWLDLSNNQLTGFPAGMGQAKRLVSLNLSNNRLHELPAEIAQMRDLLSLNLANNNFTRVPRALLKSEYLASDLRNNPLPAEEIQAVLAEKDRRRAAFLLVPELLLPPIPAPATQVVSANHHHVLPNAIGAEVPNQEPPVATPTAAVITPPVMSNSNAQHADHVANTNHEIVPLSDEEYAWAVHVQSQYDQRQVVEPINTSQAVSIAPVAPTGPALVARPPAAVTNWRFDEPEEHVESFNRFQQRLTETAEYRSGNAACADLGNRVDALVAAMRSAPALRAICFSIAHESITSCSDRLALGLNDMEQAHINHQAETGAFSTTQLLAMGDGLFKVQALNELAVAKIAALRSQGTRIDEIEIRLAYQTDLAQRLNLPGVAQLMNHRGCAHVSAADINEAERVIRQKLERNESVAFLAQWQPWRQAMERNNPHVYENIRVFNQDDRDAISIQPPRMSEQEWMDAFNQQAAMEASQVLRATMRLTREFIEQNANLSPV